MADEPRFLGALPPDRPSASVVPADWMVLASHPLLVMAWPPTWRPRNDGRGLSWQLAPAGEAYLELMGFERAVPPVDVFVDHYRQQQRRRGGLLTVEQDRPFDHPAGPAHMLQFGAPEPDGETWRFTQFFLRTEQAMIGLKVDEPLSARANHATMAEQVFATIRPR